MESSGAHDLSPYVSPASASSGPPLGGKGRGKGKGKTNGAAPAGGIQQRSGLTLPIARVSRVLRDFNLGGRVATGASVFLTAVAEYMVSEVLELAGNAAIAAHKKTIMPKHIMQAVRADSELNVLLDNVVFSQGGWQTGMLPEVHPAQPPTGKKKKSAKSSSPPTMTEYAEF